MKQVWSRAVSQGLAVQPAGGCSSHPQNCIASSSGTSLLNASATSSRSSSRPSATCGLQLRSQSGTPPLCHPCQMSPKQTCLVPTPPCPIPEQQSALLPMAFLVRTSPAALRQLPPAPCLLTVPFKAPCSPELLSTSLLSMTCLSALPVMINIRRSTSQQKPSNSQQLLLLLLLLLLLRHRGYQMWSCLRQMGMLMMAQCQLPLLVWPHHKREQKQLIQLPHRHPARPLTLAAKTGCLPLLAFQGSSSLLLQPPHKLHLIWPSMHSRSFPPKVASNQMSRPQALQVWMNLLCLTTRMRQVLARLPPLL